MKQTALALIALSPLLVSAQEDVRFTYGEFVSADECVDGIETSSNQTVSKKLINEPGRVSGFLANGAAWASKLPESSATPMSLGAQPRLRIGGGGSMREEFSHLAALEGIRWPADRFIGSVMKATLMLLASNLVRTSSKGSKALQFVDGNCNNRHDRSGSLFER